MVVGSLPVRVAGTYEYTAVATDADGDTLTYSIQSGPADATIDPATGIIDWRPTETGQFEFEILVEDGNGGSNVQAYAVDVVAGRDNRPPVITSSPIRFVETGNDYQYDVNASDSDNDPLQYFLTDAPDGLAIDRTTGLITWESGQVVGGDFSVTVEVIDGFGGRATQIWQLRVNTPPEFLSNARVAATPDVPYIYQTVVQDVDGDALQYSIVTGPAGLAIDDNGRITWTPTVDDLGTVAVEILAVDRFGARATQNFDLVVSADATLPTLDLFTSANRIDAGQAVTFEIDGADDVSIASITLSIDGIDVPLDATNSATFTFETPGVFRAVATATDSSGNVATETILVGVLDPNDNEAPVVFHQ